MTLQDILQDTGDKIVRTAKANLIKKRKRASGRLYDTMKAVVKDDELTFDMADYWAYVDEGTGPQGPFKKKGKMPPLKNIKEWCQIKGIHTDFAFAIAKKIKDKGIEPTWFFTKAFDENEAEMNKNIDAYIDSLLEENLKV